jgi:hypothetical protein
VRTPYFYALCKNIAIMQDKKGWSIVMMTWQIMIGAQAISILVSAATVVVFMLQKKPLEEIELNIQSLNAEENDELAVSA